MRKLLTSPNAMSLSVTEQTIYQNALSFVADLSLNLMAVKWKIILIIFLTGAESYIEFAYMT
jgi:hypothetical protein